MREIVPSNRDMIARASAFLRSQRHSARILVVAGSRGAAEQAAHLACDGASAGVHRFTFRQLVEMLSAAGMFARDLVAPGRVTSEAIARAAAQRVRLSYLKEVAAFPGFARALVRTIEALRLHRQQLGTVARAGRSGPDLALLLEAWESELGARGLADYAGRVELAIEAAAGEHAVLLALDLNPSTPAERQLLDTLESRAPAALRISVDRRLTAVHDGLSSVQRYCATGVPAPDREEDATAAFFSASSEALEFVEIARRVLACGRPFDEVAVLLRDPRRQTPLLEEAFARAGIPVWFERGIARRDNSGRAFLALLRCRQERYSAARFCEFLSLAPAPGHHPRWERVIREAGIIAGRERWTLRLRRPEDEDLRSFALPIIDALAALPEEAVWRDWCAALEEVAGVALADQRSIWRALDELAAVGDLGPVTLADVLDVLERLLADWQDASEDHRYGRVFAAGIEDARGMSFPLVFVPGLNEGAFPRARREDPLLLDAQRAELGIAAADDDGVLLDAALAAAAQSVTFSWSRIDLATGRERIPSFFAAEAIAAARGAATDIKRAFEDARNHVTSRIGWSAPDDPVASIDDAEYDLAAFREACTQKLGMGWLRHVNPHTARAIDARMKRWKPEWSDADGIDADFDMSAAVALEAYKPAAHIYSPTALNQFARCPYRFYLGQVARLIPVPRPALFDRLDPLTRGRVYHRTLFRHFSAGEPLDEALDAVAAAAAEELAPPVPGVWKAEIARLRADLHAWVEGRDPRWTPQFIELAFGLDDVADRDPASVPDPVSIENRWRLRGSVDMVECSPEGALRVLDHKTGRPERQVRQLCVGNGETLQPVLYAMALEALGYGPPVSAALSWGTLRGGFRIDAIPFNQRARAAATDVLKGIEAMLHRGFLPAAPRRDACLGCDYLAVCGPYEEDRVKEKDPAGVGELIRIRRLA